MGLSDLDGLRARDIERLMGFANHENNRGVLGILAKQKLLLINKLNGSRLPGGLAGESHMT
jgi:hypothetical protein